MCDFTPHSQKFCNRNDTLKRVIGIPLNWHISTGISTMIAELSSSKYPLETTFKMSFLLQKCSQCLDLLSYLLFSMRALNHKGNLLLKKSDSFNLLLYCKYNHQIFNTIWFRLTELTIIPIIRVVHSIEQNMITSTIYINKFALEETKFHSHPSALKLNTLRMASFK